MMLESVLASLHLVAILAMVVFSSSQAALCRQEWLNAAVVRRLAAAGLDFPGLGHRAAAIGRGPGGLGHQRLAVVCWPAAVSHQDDLGAHHPGDCGAAQFHHPPLGAHLGCRRHTAQQPARSTACAAPSCCTRTSCPSSPCLPYFGHAAGEQAPTQTHVKLRPYAFSQTAIARRPGWRAGNTLPRCGHPRRL